MENEKLFQIGDVARMFHLSPGSLRHYEQAGLLKPEYIDTQTGYRYYSVRQFEVLNTIRYLRALDMPIRQIEDFLKNRDIDVIQRKTLPACRMVVVKDSLQPQSYLDLEYAIRRLTENQSESVVFLGKVGVGISKERLMKHQFEQYDSVFLVLDEEDRYEGSVEERSEEKCVSIRFCGSHKEAGERYEKLMKYMEKEKLTAVDFSREITMIDYGITNNTDKFVTEICIPVKEFG